MKIVKEVLTRKFIMYLLGGAQNYAIKLGLTALLTEVFGLWYLASYIIAVTTAIIVNFFYNMHITFRAKGKKMHRFMKYVGFILLTMVIDVALVKVLTDIGIYYLVSIILVTTVLTIFKYYVFNYHIFEKVKN